MVTLALYEAYTTSITNRYHGNGEFIWLNLKK